MITQFVIFKFVSVQGIETYGKVEVELHSLLNSAEDDRWSALALYVQRRRLRYPRTQEVDWVHNFSLDESEKQSSYCL
jgi:hypothetical protein